MSRRYIFYPAWEDKDGKITTLLQDENNLPASIFERSESFIDSELFKIQPMVEPNEFDESIADYFLSTYSELKKYSNDTRTYVYKFTIDWLEEMSKEQGIVKGYVTIDDAFDYYQSEFPQEYFYWNMPTPISADMLLTLSHEEQKQYVKFFHLNTYGVSYICNLLLEVLDSIYVDWNKEGKKIILMRYIC